MTEHFTYMRGSGISSVACKYSRPFFFTLNDKSSSLTVNIKLLNAIYLVSYFHNRKLVTF